MTPHETVALDGRGRLLPGASDAAARITFDDVSFTLAVGSESRVAAYRDVSTVAIQEGSTLLILGGGTAAERFLLTRFGQAQGQVVRVLRERRLRQRFGDALMKPPTEPIELVEYQSGEEHGVGQLAYHPWGVVLEPLDERLAWIRLRRGAIESVEADEAGGRLVVATNGNSLRAGPLVMLGLGQRARVHGGRLSALRHAAQEDAGRLIGQLVPDADYVARQEATRALVDGRPAMPSDLPVAWAAMEAGVLVEPTFATSYQALRSRAAALSESRSIALAPVDPGSAEGRSWFFVPLPGNLVAMELVSEGAHATYFFRIQERSDYAGGAPSAESVRAAVRDVSEALVDSRFLREPLALPDAQIRLSKYLRYRLALRSLASLAAARERFVARIVHRDEASWGAAIDDLIVWHTSARDDSAVWPGRAAQEAMVTEAGAGDESASESDELATPSTGGT